MLIAWSSEVIFHCSAHWKFPGGTLGRCLKKNNRNSPAFVRSCSEFSWILFSISVVVNHQQHGRIFILMNAMKPIKQRYWRMFQIRHWAISHFVSNEHFGWPSGTHCGNLTAFTRTSSSGDVFYTHWAHYPPANGDYILIIAYFEGQHAVKQSFGAQG